MNSTPGAARIHVADAKLSLSQAPMPTVSISITTTIVFTTSFYVAGMKLKMKLILLNPLDRYNFICVRISRPFPAITIKIIEKHLEDLDSSIATVQIPPSQ